MNQTIVPGDASYRKRKRLIEFLLYATLISLMVCELFFDPLPFITDALSRYAKDNPQHAIKMARTICYGLFCILWFFVLGSTIHEVREGQKILKYGRYPYPGMKIAFDTPLIEGKLARRKGISYIVRPVVVFVVITYCVINLLELTHELFPT